MELKENVQCKNSVFVDLFYEDETAEENDIALYNALHDEPLPPGTTVSKIRVDNKLYMNFKNDVSFGIGGKVKVIETFRRFFPPRRRNIRRTYGESHQY